jgi:hypothetical protein
VGFLHRVVRKAAFLFGQVLAQIGLWTALASLLIPAWQTYTWLRYGDWPALPLWTTWSWLGWQFPETAWVGVQSILGWTFNQATSLFLFLSGVVVGLIGVRIAANFWNDPPLLRRNPEERWRVEIQAKNGKWHPTLGWWPTCEGARAHADNLMSQKAAPAAVRVVPPWGG